MSSQYQRAAGSATPLAFAPWGLVAGVKQLGPMTTARLKLRLLFDALRGKRQRPPRGGGPDKPESEQPDSPWDDPALWMLMMH